MFVLCRPVTASGRDAPRPNSTHVSAGYDRYIKLWDTELGECISRFTNKKVPYCVKFNPDEDKQHLFVAGLSDKKILCVSYHRKDNRGLISSHEYDG